MTNEHVKWTKLTTQMVLHVSGKSQGTRVQRSLKEPESNPAAPTANC